MRRSRETRGPAVLALLLSLLVPLIGSGCASNYHDSWTAEHPYWTSAMPDIGSGLHENLASLQAPTQFEHRLLISKLAVLVVTPEGVRQLSAEEVAARLGDDPGDEDLAIVVHVSCRSKIDVQLYVGEAVDWLLLEDGRLSAWDLVHFGSRCIYYNEFKPATGEGVALEDELRRFRNARFVQVPGNPMDSYEKGILYARAGRLAAAQEMLAKGDGTFASRGAGNVRFERPSDKRRLADASDDAALREELVRSIDALEGLSPGEAR